MHRLVIRDSAQKELRKLPRKLTARLIAKMASLRDLPRMEGVTKLSGHDKLYRARVGDYRIVYEIDDAKELITVSLVAHRRDVYRDL